MGRKTSTAVARDRGERGDTLIEVLLSVIVLGLTGVALLIAFSTSISGSAEHRRLTTANLVLSSASQQAIAQIQSNSNLFTCNYSSPVTATTFVAAGVSFSQQTTGSTYLAGSNYGSFTPTISNVEYWNGTSFQTTCVPGDAPEEVTVEVQGIGMSPIFNTFVVNLPSGNLGTAANTSTSVASQLVFATNQTESATGSPGVAFSPQPVVSVLDANNQLDATDLSPMVLSIESGPSGGSISGCSADDPGGQATFSGCIISGSGGTYVVEASVLGQSLISDPSGSALNENSVNGFGTSFWTSSPNWYTTTFQVTISGSPDKVVFASAPVAGTSGSSLATQPVIDIDHSNGTIDTSATGPVTLTLSGGMMTGCTNSYGAVVTSSNSEVIKTNATAGVVSLANCKFSGAIFYNATASPAGPDPTTYTIAASYSGAVTATSSIAVSGPGAATGLEFVTEPGGIANSSPSAAFSPQPAVEIVDAFGNPEYNLSSATVNLSFASGGTVAETISSYGQSLGNKTGIVTFTNVAGNSYGGNLSLTATYSGLSVTSSPFSISPLGGETMAFTTQPVAGLSGASLTTQPVITIYDKNGNVDTGLTATVSLTPSGGILSDCTGLTSNSGIVTVSTCLFAGTVGSPYTLSSSFTDSLSQVISVTSSSMTPTGAGTPTGIVFLQQPVGGAVAGTSLATQPSLQIVDSWGNVVTTSSATIALAASGNGTLSGCSNLTAVTGVVNVTGCTFGGTVSPVTYTITASSAGLAPVTSGPLWVTQAGTPAGVIITAAPPSVIASNVTNSQLGIQLQDAWQNPTTGTTATSLILSSSSTRGFFTSTNGLSSTLGATATVTIPPGGTGNISEYYGDENAGTPTISAVNASTTSTWGTGTINVTAAPPSQILWTSSPTTSTAGSAVAGSPTVEVEDPYGNPDSGATVTMSVNSGPGPFTGTSTVSVTTNVNGLATFTNLVLNTSGSYTIAAKDGTIVGPTSGAFTVNPAAASKIVVTAQPATTITAGGTESLSVSVEDTYGNLVSSTDPIAVTLSSGGFNAGTTTVSAVGGVANFTGLQINTAGTYTISAKDNNHTTWTATTNSFTVNPAAASKIVVTAQPATTITAGGTESLSVSVEDTYGNLVSSTDPIAVTLSSGGFNAGTATVSAVGGVANFTGLQINTAGTYTISAKDNNHTTWTATTNSFTVNSAAASKIVWNTQPATSIAGSPVVGAPSVEVEDAYNNPVNGAMVTMAVTSGPGVFISSTTSVTTGTNGIATFSNLVLDAAGSYTITASTGSIQSAASSSFNVNAAGASLIMVWGGNQQNTKISTSFLSPLSALVTDAYGNPVSGATVTFKAPTSGASGTFHATTAGGTCLASGTAQTSCTATTNAYGVATSLTFTANATAGVYAPTAGVNSVTTPFSETNTKGTLAILTGAQNFGTTSTDAGTSAGSIIIQTQDGNGNPVVQTSTLTLTLTYPVASGSLTLTTDPSTVTIPAGSSSAVVNVVSSTSSAGGTFTFTAVNASYVTATQVETVKANASSSGTAFTAITTQVVSPTTSTATYSVKMTNSTGATRYYEVASVNGLLSGETANPSSGCLSIATGNSGTITETVGTSSNRPVGSDTLDFVVEVFTASGCSSGGVYLQVDGGLTVNVGSASSIAIAGGDGQFATSSTAFTNPLTAFVTDANGNPVAAVTVTFTAPTSGAGGTFHAASNGGTCLASGGSVVTSCTAVTNSSGVASSLTFTANATPGTYHVAATAAATTPNPLYFAEDNM
jgi:type II secretory pathway pseudopilin PulG